MLPLSDTYLQTPKSEYVVKVEQRRPANFVLRGEITSKIANDLIHQIRDKNLYGFTLEVTSSGGQALPAIQLADVLHSRHATIRVVGFCASACAQYLFLAATHRVIVGSSLVLFHSSPSLLRSAYQLSGYPRQASGFDAGALQEKRLYNRIGLTASLVEIGWAGLRPLCLLVSKNASLKDPDQNRIETAAVVYIPDKSIMKRVGISFSGYWPNNSKQVAESLRLLPLSPKLTVHFLTQHELSTFKRQKGISEC